MIRALVAVSAFLLSLTVARAATLSVVKGEVLVNRGEGYESVRDDAELSPGNIAVARAGSSAKVIFSNGCTVYLGVGTVFTVPKEPPCEGGKYSRADANSLPNRSGASQDWSAATKTTVATEPLQTDVMPYLLGAAAIGGITAGALAFGGGGGSPPASP